MGLFGSSKKKKPEAVKEPDIVEAYFSDKRIEPEDIFSLKTVRTKPFLQPDDRIKIANIIRFPKTIKGYVFSRKFDARKVCIITTQRPDYKKITLGENVLLVPEPSNPYDKNAIAVISSSQRIGYIYRNGFQELLSERIKGQYIAVGTIVGCDGANDDIDIEVALYV